MVRARGRNTEECKSRLSPTRTWNVNALSINRACHGEVPRTENLWFVLSRELRCPRLELVRVLRLAQLKSRGG